MSDIFYSEVDKNLQDELNARARAGRYDRSEKSIRYMTEKIANVELVAYAEGSKPRENKEVHVLGGNTVLSGEYLPGGPTGYLTDRPYTLKDTKWAAETKATETIRTGNPLEYNSWVAEVKQVDDEKTYTNNSYRIPPHITSADLQINDNSRGTTNKATVNILIPNPDRDLNFMESIYARPGRSCLLIFEHPDSAIITTPYLSEKALPSKEILKKQFPQAANDFDKLRKMNRVQFEGVITSFEYAYQTDGTISMTIYLLGTSMVYTDLSLIMQTGTSGSAQQSDTSDTEIDNANAFYQYLITTINQLKLDRAKALGQDTGSIQTLIDNNLAQPAVKTLVDNEIHLNENGFYAWGTCADEVYREYINVNALINSLLTKIFSKIKNNNTITLFSDELNTVFSGKINFLCSSNPAEIWLPPSQTTIKRTTKDTDCYGVKGTDNIGIAWLETSPAGFYMSGEEQSKWDAYVDSLKLDEKQTVLLKSYKYNSRPGCIMINLATIQTIITDLAKDKDTFNVKSFLAEISKKIKNATGNAINLQLVTDPEIPSFLYFRDINWIGSPQSISQAKAYEIPMFANHPVGTIVRDFKFSAKLPSNVQSLMYTLNSSQNVSEEKIAPYIRFMYNNAAVSRNGNVETSTYGSKEIVQKLSEEYVKLHNKYVQALFKARQDYGNNLKSPEKLIALQDALVKYIQYPTPDIQQSCNDVAPVFPFDVEFTIDGVNGFRYGDILDFPGLPKKYKTQTTFTIVGLAHNISNTGEWTTRIRCIMRPKF